jgi:small GTP-binding protein
MVHPSPKLLGAVSATEDLDIEANILVVGTKGVGKSTLIATLTGCDVPIGSTLGTTTKDWAKYRTSSESRIAWWDSPGMESWDFWQSRKLSCSTAAVEKKNGFRFDLVIIVLRASQEVSCLILVVGLFFSLF